MLATVVHGRAIAGTALPILLAADLFAVAWYRQDARWDLLRPLFTPVAVGFALGALFFISVGTATRPLDVTIGVIVLTMVAIQVIRSVRRTAAAEPTVGATAVYGTAGGFTTFVSNTAGPIMNTYLLRLGLDKHEMIGTSAWFYFVVNMTKVPIYVALGRWSAGGPFFTRESLAVRPRAGPDGGARRLWRTTAVPPPSPTAVPRHRARAVGGRRRQAVAAVSHPRREVGHPTSSKSSSLTSSKSTAKIRVSFGAIAPPAPRLP